MPGIPGWLVPILIKYVLPAVLNAAYKAGLIGLVEKEVIEFWEGLKTYPEYPTGKNGQQDEVPHSASNIDRG